ncbi:Mlp family lipoprotein [Borrelia turicatae]|uniref:Mlp family lipoprotein n=1 Tax=Borrelia turicatae TaxID=142 RepID=UPI002ED2D2B9
MNKNIRSLILLSTVFLYCCKGYKISTVPTETQTHTGSKKTLDNLQKKTDENTQKIITLTADEKKKFNSLKHALNQVIEKLQDQIGGCKDVSKNKCTNFITWINGNIQKQKELVEAFTTSYNFLEDKRKKYEDNKDFNTYISNAIDCKANNQINQCNNDNKYGNGTNEIEQFFRGILNDMSIRNTNEEMFDCIKDGLTRENSHWGGLKGWQEIIIQEK